MSKLKGFLEKTHMAMKRLIIPTLLSAGLLLGACSTSQMAQQSYDDVYGGKAKAVVVERPVMMDRDYRDGGQSYGQADYGNDGDYGNYQDSGVDYDYDYGYASRLDRFNYGNPSRSYYDGWYSYMYDPWIDYGYNYGMNTSFNVGWGMGWGGGIGLGFGWGRPYWSNFYSPWGFYGYGYPGWGNFWGPVSYYGWGWPGYGYGWGGGMWGPGWGFAGGRPNRARPTMGVGNPNYINSGNRRYYPTDGRSSNTTRTGRERPSYDPSRRPSIDRSMDRPAPRAERPSYSPPVNRGGYGGGGGFGGGGNSGGGSSSRGRR